MSSPESPRTPESDPVWEPSPKLVRIRRRRSVRPPASPRRTQGAGPSALESVQTLAATLFVASMAAGWLALASTATAPLLAAGSLLVRGTRLPLGRA